MHPYFFPQYIVEKRTW